MAACDGAKQDLAVRLSELDDEIRKLEREREKLEAENDEQNRKQNKEKIQNDFLTRLTTKKKLYWLAEGYVQIREPIAASKLPARFWPAPLQSDAILEFLADVSQLLWVYTFNVHVLLGAGTSKTRRGWRRMDARSHYYSVVGHADSLFPFADDIRTFLERERGMETHDEEEEITLVFLSTSPPDARRGF
jgi:hypothetical protein